MSDLLLSLVALLLLVAGGAAVLAAVTVVPWSLAVTRAERRGLGPVRCGAVSALCSALGLAAALLVVRHGPLPLVVVPLALCWAGPLVVGALSPGRVAGVLGRHE